MPADPRFAGVVHTEGVSVVTFESRSPPQGFPSAHEHLWRERERRVVGDERQLAQSRRDGDVERRGRDLLGFEHLDGDGLVRNRASTGFFLKPRVACALNSSELRSARSSVAMSDVTGNVVAPSRLARRRTTVFSTPTSNRLVSATLACSMAETTFLGGRQPLAADGHCSDTLA